MKEETKWELIVFAVLLCFGLYRFYNYRQQSIYKLRNDCEQRVFQEYPARTITQFGNFQGYSIALNNCEKEYRFWNFNH